MMARAARSASAMKVRTATASSGTSLGKRLAPCSGQPTVTRGSGRIEILAEIKPLLEIRHSRGQFIAYREVAAPRTSPARKRDLHLDPLRQGEEARARFLEGMDGFTLDAVACRIEEAEFPACLPDLARRRDGVAALFRKRAHIDDRQSSRHCPCLLISPMTAVMTHSTAANEATATAGNRELTERLPQTGDVVRGVTVFIAGHWKNNLPVPRSPPQRNTASVCHLNGLH